MKFTELLENYKEKNLKALSEMITEEPTEDEFNKEVSEVKEKSTGKIRNKKISKASVQAVSIQKEDLNEDGIGPLGYYVHHNKTGKITLHTSRKSASNASNKHDVAHGAIISTSGAYYKDGNNSDIAKKALDMHMTKLVKEDLDESDECANKPIWGKPSRKYMDNAGNNGVKPDYSKKGETYKRIAASAERLRKGITKKTYKDLDERTLSDSEGDKKENIVHGMKKNKKSFKDLYGKRAKEVMYATATKMAKEDFDFQEVDVANISEETLNEWNASGHKLSKANKWIKANGFDETRHGKHPVFIHKTTGVSVTGFNTHGNEAGAEALRNTRNQIIKHHQENKIKYLEL
ncbi:hypothetical protein M0R04_05130 [Candidatus Dojkabacteria bacterium]|jgi:hypothetical protein|nr:hypothetical protein [Candidatus Dojkabacteria bacterium]